MALTPEQISTNLSANYMAVKPTLVGANAVDLKRQQQIFANLQNGYNANQGQFVDRQAFESSYGYSGKPAGEKVLLDTFYKTVNPESVTVRSAVPNVAKPKGLTINSSVVTTPVSQVPKQTPSTGMGITTSTSAPVPATIPKQTSHYVLSKKPGQVTSYLTEVQGEPKPKTSLIKKGTRADGSTVEVHDHIDGQTLAVIKSPTGEMSWQINYPDGTIKTGLGWINDANKKPAEKTQSDMTAEEKAKDNTDWAKGIGKYAPGVSGSTNTSSTPSTTSASTTKGTTPSTDFTYVPKTDTKKEDTKVTPYTPIDKGILNANEDSLNASKFQQLLKSKNKDIENATSEYNNGMKVLKNTNANIRALYGIDEKGNIDPNDTTSLAYTQNAALTDYTKVKNDLLSEYTGTRLNNVKAQTFQILAQRNITDVSKVSPEMFIQLSGEIGASAMNDIYQAKEKTVNDIEARKKEVQAKLDSLRENGMIKNNEFLVASETLRASSERLKQSINKQFANDVFGLVDMKNAKSEARSTDVLNTIQKFGAQLGITGKGLVAFNDYVGKYKNSADALAGMLADLGDKNSNIYKAIESAEQRAAISAALTQQQKLELAAANKKSPATKTSMTWGLKDRTLVSTSFINKVKDGLGGLVKDSATKAFANEIADAYYKSQGTEASKGPDGFMDDSLVAAVPAQFAKDFVTTYLSPNNLTNDKMTYGLGMFPEVMKSVSGDTVVE